MNGNGYHGPQFTELMKSEANEGVSGRRFVVSAVVGVLMIWGAVTLAFHAWQRRYLAVAEFGTLSVAPLVDPLAARVPPGVDPSAWRAAVADTHAMLVALTAAGLLDQGSVEGLRDDLKRRVDRCTAETARQELTDLWTDLERKAGPVLSPNVTPARPGSRQTKRHPRPSRPELLKQHSHVWISKPVTHEDICLLRNVESDLHS